MKFIKKITKWIKGFIVRWKYLFLSAGAVIFCIWLFCLPEDLFDDPTSTVLLDKNGNLLGATIASDGQWRFPPCDSVPHKYKTCLIQFEDRNYYNHIGVSLKGMSRAIYQNLKEQRKVSGGSTITMQVMRMARKGQRRNIFQKVIEIFWATRAEFSYSKDEILNLYASNAPMGGNVVGLDAASWRYFGRPSYQLTWAESATLAVLPNAPSLMHPGKNRDELLAKRNRLLDRIYAIGEIDSTTWVLSKLEPLPDKPHDIPRVAPHLMNRIINDGMIGQVVHTTIDIAIQENVNNTVQFHHEHLRQNEIFNAAVMVMEVETGNVVAYTGNIPELEEEHGKDVDIITAPRSTGSIIKPFLYAGMIEDGLITPAMIIQDIPTVMSGYSPKNYNLKYGGMVPANEALAKSLNVPLVRMLTKFGVPKFHFMLNKLKFTTIDKLPSHYGLSLILGGAEVNLWDLVSAYGIMARSLKRYPNYGNDINRKAHYLQRSEIDESEAPLINPATCWYTFEAMKEVMRPDDDINWELFSTSRQIAWKTGTSFGFRDAWAVGLTQEYVVGVWVGNADGEGRPGLIGREAAAPILFDVFSGLPQSDWFRKPFDEMKEVEICVSSGYRAGDACAHTKKEWIPKSCLNTTACPYHQWIYLDQEENYQVNSSCYNLALAKKRSWFVLPAVAEYFYLNHDPNYRKLPPFDPNCDQFVNTDEMAILYPKDNSSIFVPVNFDEEKEHVVFEATHKDPKARLFWHLDEQYMGETTTIHQLDCQPKIGPHVLTVVDQNGKSVVVEFEVIGD